MEGIPLNDDFVYGFIAAVVVVSGLLALQYGDNFNFLRSDGFTVLPSFGTAVNWKSAICLSVVFGLFFKNLGGSLKRRIFDGFWILALGWALMDFFWILKAAFSGNFLFGSQILTLISNDHLIIGLFRNSLMIIGSCLFSRKLLKLSRSSVAAFGVVVFYWIFLMVSFPFSGYFFNTFIFYGVSFLPFVIIVKTWSGLSWRKFLFV